MDRWREKLLAWTGDPGEKAMSILGNEIVQESPSLESLRRELGLTEAPFNDTARWWADAADSLTFPNAKNDSGAWNKVVFSTEGELIHSLIGEVLKVSDFVANEDHEGNFDHLTNLVRRDSDGTLNYRETFFAFWRFGPSVDSKRYSKLVKVLPADPRTPDHSIWHKLDLCSAFSSLLGTSDEDADIALVEISIGPVQEFIAQSRSTSDLWSGSHLLSSLSFEAASVVVENYGPDNIVFPALRGNPMMDEWLLKTFSHDETNSSHNETKRWWRNQLAGDTFSGRVTQASNRTNPLYTSTIPNKVVAIVPWSEVESLGEKVQAHLRETIHSIANGALDEVLGLSLDELSAFDDGKLKGQIDKFPEIAWTAIRWPGPVKRVGADGASQDLLKNIESIRNFGKELGGDQNLLFESEEWRAVETKIEVDGEVIFTPNPGVLYGPLHATLESLHSGQKQVAPVGQLVQVGYRCTICGEREWISDDPDEDRSKPRRERGRSNGGKGTIWDQIAKKNTWRVRRGEYLCVICTIKRAWPSLVANRIAFLTGKDRSAIPRQIISTHTMAAAGMITEIIEQLQLEDGGGDIGRFLEQVSKDPSIDLSYATLPAKISRDVAGLKSNAHKVGINKLAQLIEEQGEADENRSQRILSNQIAKAKSNGISLPAGMVRQIANPDSYYSIVMMDGDSIGEWLSMREGRFNRKYKSSLHSSVRDHLEMAATGNSDLERYLNSDRVPSPLRHIAISDALSTFSSTVSRFAVEQHAAGQLIYCGGDDVLAFLPVGDLLETIELLRYGFSGTIPTSSITIQDLVDNDELYVKDGWLMIPNGAGFQGIAQTLSSRATASVGAVIAHKSTPLPLAIRRAREAEALAKSSGRNTFALRVMKRSGGDVGVIGKFDSLQNGADSKALLAIAELANLMAGKTLSRTFLHNLTSWLDKFPMPNNDASESVGIDQWWDTVEKGIAFQISRQSTNTANSERIDGNDAMRIASVIVTSVRGTHLKAMAFGSSPSNAATGPARSILAAIEVAEFLGRRTDRVGVVQIDA